MITLNLRPSDRELRQFSGIWLPLAVAIVLAWLWYHGFSSGVLIAVALMVVAVCGAGWYRPQWLRPLFVAWLCAAFPIGWLVSHAALALTYYLLITPVGLVRRTLGHDPLCRRFDRQAATYWSERRQPTDESRYFSQF